MTITCRIHGYYNTTYTCAVWFVLHDKTNGSCTIEHFYSVFTKDHNAIIPEMSDSTYPAMPSIEINNEGIAQLLSNIDPFKAMGPDGYHLDCLRNYQMN